MSELSLFSDHHAYYFRTGRPGPVTGGLDYLGPLGSGWNFYLEFLHSSSLEFHLGHSVGDPSEWFGYLVKFRTIRDIISLFIGLKCSGVFGDIGETSGSSPGARQIKFFCSKI